MGSEMCIRDRLKEAFGVFSPMSDGDTARETVGPDSHRDPEAWCSGRGHYRPERPRPGVPDGDITGTNGGSLVFPDGDIAGQNARGLVFPEGDITGPNARSLVFRTGTLQARIAEVFRDGDITGPDSQHDFRRVGTVGFRSFSRILPVSYTHLTLPTILRV